MPPSNLQHAQEHHLSGIKGQSWLVEAMAHALSSSATSEPTSTWRDTTSRDGYRGWRYTTNTWCRVCKPTTRKRVLAWTAKYVRSLGSNLTHQAFFAGVVTTSRRASGCASSDCTRGRSYAFNIVQACDDDNDWHALDANTLYRATAESHNLPSLGVVNRWRGRGVAELPVAKHEERGRTPR